MLRSSDLLQTYARILQRLISAEAVSIFLPATSDRSCSPLLIHEGPGSPLPHLENAEAAEDFIRDLEPQQDVQDWVTNPTRLSHHQVEGGWLVGVPSPQILTALSHLDDDGSTAGRRQVDRSVSSPPEAAVRVWLGLRLRAGKLPPGPADLSADDDPSSWWSWLFGLGGALAWHAQRLAAALQDPVSQLPARAGFQVQLAEAIQQAQEQQCSLALLFINPDDFTVVNERFGREIGNQVIREVATRLRTVLRSSDLVGRYGGAVFAAALLDTSEQGAASVLTKLRQELSEKPYRNSSVRLGFSFGIAAFTPISGPGAGEFSSEDESLELIRRADQALVTARETRGDGSLFTQATLSGEGAPHLDRLSGIFTANLAKDYRNMLLLWDTVTIVTTANSFEGLAGHVAERLFTTFKADQVGVLATDGDDGLRLVESRARLPRVVPPDQMTPTFELDEGKLKLLEEARRTGRSAGGRMAEEGPEHDRFAYAFPLVARGRCLGCLYLEGDEGWLNLDNSDLIFLRALSSHVAVAFDRALLAQRERQRQEQEKRHLRAELQHLRQALQEAKLVYRSPQMEALLETLSRAARTDATVLITGESGTGKELVAQTLHELSQRSQAPLVIVDCAAIAHSLIESELFGHRKGAYTGAQQGAMGRLAEAHEGTILLDEVGELPLEVQSKLLRFVQEKQLTPVGGVRPRTVDVRVIAATNRDLEAESNAGKFRQDLFYRLNVVRIQVPALRERPDDILFLANHFLKRFSIQYQKGLHSLSREAEQAMVAYPWPGNVRELENRLRQAVILSDSPIIEAGDLSLNPQPVEKPPVPVAAAVEPPSPTASWNSDPDALWVAFQQGLKNLVSATLEEPAPAAFPLGRWLSEDLILEADQAASGVKSLGAEILGIAETTFRRRWLRLVELKESGLLNRSDSWEDLLSLISSIIEVHGGSGEDLLQTTRRRLLQEVREQLDGNVRLGAGLMGVSEPTLRRWMAESEG